MRGLGGCYVVHFLANETPRGLKLETVPVPVHSNLLRGTCVNLSGTVAGTENIRV